MKVTRNHAHTAPESLIQKNAVTTAGCQIPIRDGKQECQRGRRAAGGQGEGWSDADTLLATPRLHLVLQLQVRSGTPDFPDCYFNPSVFKCWLSLEGKKTNTVWAKHISRADIAALHPSSLLRVPRSGGGGCREGAGGRVLACLFVWTFSYFEKLKTQALDTVFPPLSWPLEHRDYTAKGDSHTLTQPRSF